MISASLFSDVRIVAFISSILVLGILIWFITTKCPPKKRNIITSLMLIVLVAFALCPVIFPGVIKETTPPATSVYQLGGTVFSLRVQASFGTDGEKIPVRENEVQQAVQTIEKRLKALGISNSLVKSKGDAHIDVELPGISPEDAQRAKSALIKLAKLELKAVHPENSSLADQVAADPDDNIVPGYELKVLHDTDDDGHATSENILLKRRAALDGSYIIHAQELYGPYEGKLSVELNNAGGDKMFALTKNMTHGRDRLAIVLDGVILSAPTVQSSLGTRFEISGMKDAAEAKDMAAALLNPLRNPLILEEERTISAKLAAETSEPEEKK